MLRRRLVARHRWLVFLLPMVVYMLVGALEPSAERPGGASFLPAIPYAGYPCVYTLKLALTLLAIGLVWPGYREFPLRSVRGPSWWAWWASSFGLGCVI